MTIADLAHRVADRGYVLLPERCTASFVSRTMAAALQRIGDVRAALGNRRPGIGSAAGFEEIVQRSPGRWDVPVTLDRFGVRESDLPWWPLVCELLGADAVPSFSGVVYSEPGSPAQYWHIDSPHVAAGHRAAHALNVLLALHDIPLSMGPTEIAEGSHRLTNHLQYPALVRDELVYQHATTTPALLVQGTSKPAPATWKSALPAGSALLFDDRVLHRGLANATDAVRYVAYFSYRRADYDENTHFEATRSVFD